MIAAEDLYVMAADRNPATIRNLTAAKEAWIGEFSWAPDSRSILYISDEQTSESGAHMFEQPINRVSLADDRLGVMGASYGGYMTSWIVTQTGRFKAASTGCSVNDITPEYYLSDAGEFIVEYFGYPWVDGAALAAHSPITFAANVTTRLLIQHGEDDLRVPLSQAREFYKALKTLHKTVEFDIYPRGNHVNFEPKLERSYMLRNLAWFEQWLMRDTSR
jgi:dipeptidyl aminopeptidase/acylaminoacyl peptidase